MLLSESYKKRLLELAGVIQEKDNRQTILNKIKLPQEVAEWAHGMSEKYSLWIANTFKEYLYDQIKEMGSGQEGLGAQIVDAFEKGRNPSAFKGIIRKSMNSKEGGYRHITDWLSRRQTLAPETDNINFKTLTFEEALRRSEAWHEALAQLERGKIEDEDGEVVMTFPDGFYWVNLGKSSCGKEGKAMGHCGSGQGTLFSLRKDGYPYITTDISNDGDLYQMRGRANTKPKQELHKYILPFLFDYVNRLVYNGYKPEQNFRPEDVSKEDIKKILKTKPTLLQGFTNQVIQKFGSEEANSLFSQYPEVLTIRQLQSLNLNLEQLQKIINKNPKIFSEAKLIAFNFTPEQIDYLLDTILVHLSTNQIQPLRLSSEQLQKIINKSSTFFDNANLSDFHFSPEQINYFVNNTPHIFDGQGSATFAKLNKQQIRELIDHNVEIFRNINLDDAGFDDEDIYYLISKDEDNDILTNKQLVKYLSEDGFKKLYEVNKSRFNSAFINFKFGNEEDYKKIKVEDGKILPNGNVELYFSDWNDEDLTGLFKNEDSAKSIANYDLDFYDYEHKFYDLSYTFDDINDENLQIIREALKISLGKNFPKDAITTSQIFDILNNDDEYEIDNLNTPGPEEIKQAFTWTVDDCQRDADGGEYWKLYVDPIKELFGDDSPTRFDIKTKNKDGKEENKQVLKFVLSHDKFLDFFECTEEYETQYDDTTEYEYSIHDNLYPISVISTCLSEDREELEVNEPHYGVNGDVTSEELNRVLSERLSETNWEFQQKTK